MSMEIPQTPTGSLVFPHDPARTPHGAPIEPASSAVTMSAAMSDGACRSGGAGKGRVDRGAADPLRRVDSAQLLGGAREVVIEHRGEHYRLRHTRNDKLILTK